MFWVPSLIEGTSLKGAKARRKAVEACELCEELLQSLREYCKAVKSDKPLDAC